MNQLAANLEERVEKSRNRKTHLLVVRIFPSWGDTSSEEVQVHSRTVQTQTIGIGRFRTLVSNCLFESFQLPAESGNGGCDKDGVDSFSVGVFGCCC